MTHKVMDIESGPPGAEGQFGPYPNIMRVDHAKLHCPFPRPDAERGSNTLILSLMPTVVVDRKAQVYSLLSEVCLIYKK